MIDGLKIFCPTADVKFWRDGHPDLKFPCLSVSDGETGEVLATSKEVPNLSIHDESTGEVLEIEKDANFRGMIFSLTPSRQEAGKVWCSARGSLNRYFRDGQPNVLDLTFGEVCEAVADFGQRFGIQPGRAKLQSLEFGVNIALHTAAATFLKHLVCHAGEGNYKGFSNMGEDGKRIGKVAVRRRYSLKIYDKGKQSGTGETDLLRVEIHVKDMEWLKTQDIQTLADLTDPEKIRRLGQVLFQSFAGVIFYDASISPGNLTDKEQLFLAKCENPKHWIEDLTVEQRRYGREKFGQLVAQHGANEAYRLALETLPKLWLKLLAASGKNSHQREAFFGTTTAENSDQLTAFETRSVRQNSHQRELMMNIPLMGINGNNNNNFCPNMTLEVSKSYLPQNPPFPPPNAPTDEHQNKGTGFHISEPVLCGCCGAKIQRKAAARFCASKRCQNQARNERRRSATKNGASALADVLQKIQSVVSIKIYLTDPTDPAPPRRREIVGTVTRQPSALAGHPFPGIRCAVLVEVFLKSGEAVRLVRSHAKNFIRALVRMDAQPPTPPTIAPPTMPAPQNQPPKNTPPPPPTVQTASPQPRPVSISPPPKFQPPQKTPPAPRQGEKLVGELATQFFQKLKNGQSW